MLKYVNNIKHNSLKSRKFFLKTNKINIFRKYINQLPCEQNKENNVYFAGGRT